MRLRHGQQRPVVRKIVRGIALVYVAYLALALLVISPALNFLPHKYLQDTYGRELRTGWVLFNPFKVSLDVSAATLGDKMGERFVGFSEASIDLSLASLWQPGWVLDAVKIRDLDLDLTRMTADEYNFSDLLASDTPQETPEDDDGNNPGLTVHDLDLHSATIVLTDQAREKPFISRWNGLHIRAMDISTVFADGRPFSVEVDAEDGGSLHWAGEVSLPRGNSAGRLALANINLRNLWLFAEPWLQLELTDGRLEAQADYQLDWNDGVRYRVDAGHIGLSAINIVPLIPDALPDTAVGLKTLDINNIALDSKTQQVTIDTLTINGLSVATWMEDAHVSLEQLFAVQLPSASAAANEKTADAENSADKGWSVALNKAQLLDGSLLWRSQFTAPAQLNVRPLEASIEHLNWPLSGDSLLAITLAVNEQANIAATGTLALAQGHGSIDYTLDGLPLTWFNPNLPSALKATVTGGEVNVKGQVALQDYAPATLALGGNIKGFSARQENAETMLTGWDTVRFDELAVDLQQHSLVLKKLAIDGYTGRLHIQKDGSINASNVWKEEVGEQAQQIAGDLTEDKPWSFSLPTIEISDSQIDFMDQSLPIHFRTVIGELEGEVLNINSTSRSTATVQLKGSVDGYAPVSLTGKIAPFATTPDLDLNLTFDGVDLALLSPYSGVYAGYAIEQGLLDLDLRYALKNNQLQGNNAIRIEKLKLGEKISGDKAVDIPLELALAILTDSNGVIDMAVPVTGDVDNPEFALGSVIAKAFINIITKAITAPFSLLANLVSSEEDLQRLTFASGSAQLNDANKQKLTQLAAALTQRPNLSLAITGRLNLANDRTRLQKNTLKAQLLENGLPAQDLKARGAEWEDAIAELYADLPAGNAETPATTAREQYAEVVQSIAVPDAQLRTLAEDRAVTVKRYLLNEAGLATDRAVVAQVSLDAADNAFSGVTLDMGGGMGN